MNLKLLFWFHLQRNAEKCFIQAINNLIIENYRVHTNTYASGEWYVVNIFFHFSTEMFNNKIKSFCVWLSSLSSMIFISFNSFHLMLEFIRICIASGHIENILEVVENDFSSFPVRKILCFSLNLIISIISNSFSFLSSVPAKHKSSL